MNNFGIGISLGFRVIFRAWGALAADSRIESPSFKQGSYGPRDGALIWSWRQCFTREALVRFDGMLSSSSAKPVLSRDVGSGCSLRLEGGTRAKSTIASACDRNGSTSSSQPIVKWGFEVDCGGTRFEPELA
jgi:hypothetical protein